MIRKTPRKIYGTPYSTPAQCSNFSKELKQALNERNALTAKSRKKLCDMLDSDDDKTPIKNDESKKRITFRHQAIEEILSSERSYIQQLEKLVNFFVLPLKEKQLITYSQFNALFGQLEMIYNLNREFLLELEQNLDNVAKAFLRMAPFFKLYSVYAFDYNKAQLILQDLTEKNGSFRKFLEKTESRPEVQMKLISLLITPIQRIPRYRLLLQQVLFYSSPSDGDFKILQESIREIENTVSHMNTVVQDHDVTQLMIDLQNSFVNHLPTIVKPGRKVIKQGVLQKISSNGTSMKRHCVLMSDIFLYCKILKASDKNVANSLECCCIFPLKKCRVIETFPGTFKITCQGDGIILCSTNHDAVREWIQVIRETIELHIQYRKTIRKGSSKRKPLRKKDLHNFESDQLMSPTKRKYDYETVSRFASESDNDESKSDSNCFAMNPVNFFRRTYNGSSSTRHQLSVPKIVFNNSTLQQNFQFEPTTHQVAASPNAINKILEENETADPTYGFANFAARNNVYFQSNCNNNYQQQIFTTPPTSPSMFQDILFPLRTSTGSKKSDKYNQQNQSTVIENGMVNNCELNNGHNSNHRKRVKFNENIISNFSPPPVGRKINHIMPMHYSNNQNHFKSERFNFSVDNSAQQQQRLSLRQRLTNFFSNLF